MEILESIGGCFHQFTLSHGLVISLFVGGLIGGITHCAGMCGPFILSQSKNIEKIEQTLLLPYHFGRITTYVFLAVIFHSFLNLAFLFVPQKALLVSPLLALASVMFLTTAFPKLSSLFPWINSLRFYFPHAIVSRGIKVIDAVPKNFKPFVMGLLLGFMPCGLVIAALMASATAPDISIAAISMAAFGLGTVPMLMVIALGGHALKRKYPATSQHLSQVFAIWSSFWLLALAVGMFLK